MVKKKDFLNNFNKKLNEELNQKFSKKETEQIFNVFNETLEEAILEGEFKLGKLFTAKIVERAPRKARNPRTGEEILVEAKKALKFRISENFKKTVAGA